GRETKVRAQATKAQAASPATNTQVRTLPRCRIVARSALYSSSSRSVINCSVVDWPQGTHLPITRERRSVLLSEGGQEWHRTWLVLSCGGSSLRFPDRDDDNSLAALELPVLKCRHASDIIIRYG